MNFMQRAISSVVRRKGKSVILFLVIFVLGNVIAGAVAISQSTSNVEKDVKGKLGATASIAMDHERFWKENENEKGEVTGKFPAPPKLEIYDKIGALPYVKYYDYNVNSGFESKKLQRFEFEGSDIMMGGMGSTFLTVKGINYPDMVDIKENKIKLVEGQLLTQDDIDKGAAKVIISKQFAEKNNLKVGDQLVMDATNASMATQENTEEKTIDFPVTVIGLFEQVQLEVKSEPKKNSEQYFNQQIMNTEQINLIYTTNKAAIDFTKRQMELYADQPGMQEEIARSEDEGNFYQPIYVLKSPEDVVAFRQEVQPLLPDYYIVNDSTEQYDQIGGSLKKMSQISSYVVIVATVATLAIISLVVLLFMRDRKHELGVYLSLGESRGKVIGQIVLETLVVSLLALLISLVTGNLLGSAVSNSLISSDLFGSPNSGGMMMGGALYNPMLSSEDVMQAYQVTFSTGYIFSFLGLGLLTVALSTIAPLTYISRLNPKKIMM